MNDSQRIEWLAGMHTLHRKVEFLYAVTGYQLTVTHDDYELERFYADENDHGGMVAAWRAVIDMAAEQWQPIETAPRNGEVLLAWPRIELDDDWEYAQQPTHWAPLPEPPHV